MRATPVPVAPVAWCPYCAAILEPVPTTSRRCTQCRQRMILKRVDGRSVLLVEASLPVFEAERRRLADAPRFSRECGRWLRLAAVAGAASERVEVRARAAQVRPSEAEVEAARALYLTAVERAFRQARHEGRWEDASRIRRDQAQALHRVEGSPTPPSAEVLRLHREGAAVALRGIAEILREAELVTATCCDACRADDRLVVRITAELRAPRLPHPSCPRGLCGCRWRVPARHRAAVRRHARRGATPEAHDEPVGTLPRP